MRLKGRYHRPPTGDGRLHRDPPRSSAGPLFHLILTGGGLRPLPLLQVTRIKSARNTQLCKAGTAGNALGRWENPGRPGTFPTFPTALPGYLLRLILTGGGLRPLPLLQVTRIKSALHIASSKLETSCTRTTTGLLPVVLSVLQVAAHTILIGGSYLSLLISTGHAGEARP